MNKKSYKVVTLATLLSIGVVNAMLPIHSFAQSTTTGQESSQQVSPYGQGTTEMKSTLNKLGSFAQAMNMYSLMLIKNPDVNFEGIQIKGHESLPADIQKDQVHARENAKKWENNLKPTLITTNQNIINYDTRFEKYYSVLVDAVKNLVDAVKNKDKSTLNKDKSTLTEGISNLQTSIKHNREAANQLREQLKTFRGEIGADSRAFSSDISVLSSILNAQTGGIPEDEKKIQELMEQIAHYNQVWSDGVIVVSIPTPHTWISGGIMLAVSASKLKELEPLLQEFKTNLDYKKTLSRVAGVASGSLQNMLGAVNGAIDTLGEMCAHWDTVDAKYDGLLQHINDASEVSLSFVLPELEASKASWSDLKKQADVLNEAIKELKITPTDASKS